MMAGFQSQSEGVEKIRGLMAWAKESTRGHANVNVTNMTSSWKDGLAFCAIIHRFRPDLIDFSRLKAGDVLENNRLAFSVAEEELGIPALLDPEDMVEMAVPDRLCVITYVSQLHAHFKNCKPEDGDERKEAIGKNWRDKAGLKRPSAVPYFPVPRPTKKRGTLEDICTICRKKVYILERSLVEGKLYHRVCYKESLSPKKKETGVDKAGCVKFILETKDVSSSSSTVAASTTPTTNSKLAESPPSSRRSSKSSRASSSSPSTSSTTRGSKSPSASPRRVSRSPSRPNGVAVAATTPSATSEFLAAVVEPQPRPRPAPRLSTTTTTTTSTKEAMTKFLEDEKDGKKPPIPAVRSSIGRIGGLEESSSAAAAPVVSTSPPSAAPAAVGARINRMMSEQNNNAFCFDFEDKSKSKEDVGAGGEGAESGEPVGKPPSQFAEKRSKYLGLDDADREVSTATTRRESDTTTTTRNDDVRNLKPIPVMRKIESEKFGDKDTTRDGADPASSASASSSSSSSVAKLSPSKVVSKGTLERREAGERKQAEKKEATGSSGKPTLFVKPMIKPQIAQHRRLYLAHFDVDGKVEVTTDDVGKNDLAPAAVSKVGDIGEEISTPETNDNKSSSTNPSLPSLPIASAATVATSAKDSNISVNLIRTKPSPSKRATVITTTSTSHPAALASATGALPPSSASSSASSSAVPNSKNGGVDKRTTGQLRIQLPETKPIQDNDKLSPSNPFFEGEEEELKEEDKRLDDDQSAHEKGKPRDDDGGQSSRETDVLTPTNPFSDGQSSRETDVLTPTNPFSDDFVDDEGPLAECLRKTADDEGGVSVDADLPSSTNGTMQTPPKIAPSKPPRILLKAETVEKKDDEEEEEEEVTPTNPPESPCKRILSVDKSLLSDLKVPLYGRNRDSRVSSVSAGDEKSKSSRTSSPASVIGSETEASPSRRKAKRKAPPPPSEFQPRLIRSSNVTVALDTIEKELQAIDEEQQLLEEKGVALETKLRSEEEQEDEAAMELAWVEWFQLVNRKNELFRREMELYHTRRMQELEDKHSEVERDIRILGNIPGEKKTAKDLEREEWLIKELVAIVNERNKVVDAVEMDRQREKAEDESIEQMRERRLTIAPHQLKKDGEEKKSKKSAKEEKKREKKERKRLEREKKKEEKETNKTPSKGFALTFKRKMIAEKT